MARLTSVHSALRLLFLLTAVLAHPFCAWPDAASPIEAYQTGRATTRATASLKRGINFGDAMEAAPNEGDWGWKLSASAFRIVKEAGFDHVRVPMRISAHAGTEIPYEISPRFLSRIDWVIGEALSRDLAVVIDMHHYEEIMEAPAAHANRLVELWRQIATRYRKLPPAVVFEILNEPRGNLTADIWNPILARTIAAIRAIDPDRTLIIEGANWASAKDLRDTLHFPANDKNLIASFHLYAPNYFTHQGAHWMADQFQTRGLVFPGPPAKPVDPLPAANAHAESREFFARYNKEPEETNPGGPSAITQQMQMAQDFAQRTGLRVYMGEFGSIARADVKSRARWTSMARTEAEKRGFGWAYWDFCRSFKARTACGPGGRWIPEIKAALLD